MAAPDAKSSPSNKEIQQTSSELITNDNACFAKDGVVEEDVVVDTTVPILTTYESSETSEKYILAKSLLASGEFEQSLGLTEEAIQETRAMLESQGVGDTDLHESMAPFHYLYGTTLLYSIEESNDTQMTVAPSDGDVNVDADADPESPPDEGEEAPSSNDQFVEDMEIAWENLDTARNIVEAMLARDAERTQEVTTKLQLDLAQILLREGDLQRMNGRYSEAITDYEACLRIRKLWLPPFDRKIADAQYNLGLSYLSNSTELQRDESPDATKIKVGQDHCQKGVQLYVDCAHTLCGQIAGLCAIDPEMVLCSNDGEGKAGLKTTGLNEADVALSDASHTLNAWRQTVAALTPVEESDPRLADLKELLDEIQETIDEADRSQQAVREASQLRHQAQKAITQSDDGSTTQIGFGEPTISTEVAASATADKPMMIVKKKKKRDVETTDEEASDAKRTKTE